MTAASEPSREPGSAPAAAEPAEPSRDEYLHVHRLMCATKALDDRMHVLVRQGRAPFVGSARGHEGIQVAATAALRPDDWLVPHYRGLGNAVARGLTAREWMLAVFARAGDPLSGGRNIPGGCFSHPRLRIAPVSQVVASWIPKAAGIAYASKLRGDGAVTLCTFGDGATSKGDFHEGLNFAAVHRLPVVFVCENNGYAISVPLRLQTANPAIADRAAGYGMRGVAVDGTDVPACYAAAREAVARARAGEGPTLIEHASGASTRTRRRTTRPGTARPRRWPRRPATIRSSASRSGSRAAAGWTPRRRGASRTGWTARPARRPTGQSASPGLGPRTWRRTSSRDPPSRGGGPKGRKAQRPGATTRRAST